MNKSETELWKALPGVPGVEVSTLGNVRTQDCVVCDYNREHFIKGGIRKRYTNGSGYLQVNIFINGKWVMESVHRLVAKAFIPNPDNLPQVNHKDCNRTNNNVDNLEWCDNSYNVRYREKYGVSQTETLGHPVYAINLKTQKPLRFRSQSEAGRQLNADVGSINKVLKGRQKKTHDCWFTYADSSAVEDTRAKFGDKIADKVTELADKNQK